MHTLRQVFAQIHRKPLQRVLGKVPVLAGASFATLISTSVAMAEAPKRKPIVIAHRGASGYRPEHTIEAYSLAIEMGADFIEPDLVVTKDGVLISRHENELSGTTDVAVKFPQRRKTATVNGVSVTGFFSEDLTLAEIKTLRAKERIADARPQNAAFDGRFEIPTLAEIVALVKRAERKNGRKVGIYPETKHPTYFRKEGEYLGGGKIGVSLGRLLIDTLVALEFTDPKRVFIQSFEVENLIELHKEIMPQAGVDLPLVQLLGDLTGEFIPPKSSFSRPYDMVYNATQGADLEAFYGKLASLVVITPKTEFRDLVQPRVLRHIAGNYADGIGPWTNSFLLRKSIEPKFDGNGDGVAEIATQLTGEIHPLLDNARRAGLLIHPYTCRAEERFRTLKMDGTVQTVEAEIHQLLGLGVDGFFIDQPDLGVAGRASFRRRRPRKAASRPSSFPAALAGP